VIIEVGGLQAERTKGLHMRFSLVVLIVVITYCSVLVSLGVDVPLQLEKNSAQLPRSTFEKVPCSNREVGYDYDPSCGTASQMETAVESVYVRTFEP
jgi:hypothetical protein